MKSSSNWFRLRYRAHIYIEWHETASRTSLWYCPTQRAVNVQFSRHQSRSLRESLYGRRYIRRSRDPRRCLLEAFTAFRLSIKDKVSRGLPFSSLTHLMLIALRSRNADAYSLGPWRNIVYTVRCEKRSRKGVQERYLSNVTSGIKRSKGPEINVERNLLNYSCWFCRVYKFCKRSFLYQAQNVCVCKSTSHVHNMDILRSCELCVKLLHKI